jgi:omega-amidase
MTSKINDLRVTLVQPDIIWKSAGENLVKYTAMLEGLSGKTDLVLLPEMFPTGFDTEPKTIAETMDGDSVRWMKRTAETLKCSVAGSLVIRENRWFFNRLVFIDQYENLTWYDKRHLFRMAGEELKFSAGRDRQIVPLKGWRVCFQICYDLRFPVWSRNQDDYDVLVYSSNWPAARSDVWNTLLKARAIENQSYAIGINRVGTDGNGIAYIGESLIINPKGAVTGEFKTSKEEVKTFTLSWNELNEFREKFPAWRDRDEFIVKRDKGQGTSKKNP